MPLRHHDWWKAWPTEPASGPDDAGNDVSQGVMRLAPFILRDVERILVEWEAFAAAQLPAAAHMKPLALRDHARQILEAVATDLSTSQSKEAQACQVTGPGSQTDWRPGDRCPDACASAGAERVRHQPAGRGVPCAARQRSSSVGGRLSAREPSCRRHHSLQRGH